MGERAQKGAHGGGGPDPAESDPVPAWRSRSASLIESAPATVPASSDITFDPAFAPPLLAAPTILTRSVTTSGSPIPSASATTGTSPASATRFASSKATSITVAA